VFAELARVTFCCQKEVAEVHCLVMRIATVLAVILQLASAPDVSVVTTQMLGVVLLMPSVTCIAIQVPATFEMAFVLNAHLGLPSVLLVNAKRNSYVTFIVLPKTVNLNAIQSLENA